MDPYFVRSLLRDTVLVKPHMIGSNYREVCLHLLNKRFEGLCSRHGFIVPGTVSVHKVNNAKVQAFSLNGDVCYTIQYYASVCNPPIGSVLPARVVNMNKFGVMAHSGIAADDGTFLPVIESIVTRQPIGGGGEGTVSEVDLDTVKIGDSVFVEILGKKFELNDEKISVIGRLVASAKPAAMARKKGSSSLWDVVTRQVAAIDEEYEEDLEEYEEEDVDAAAAAAATSKKKKKNKDKNKDGKGEDEEEDEEEDDKDEDDDDEDEDDDEDDDEEDDEDENEDDELADDEEEEEVSEDDDDELSDEDDDDEEEEDAEDGLKAKAKDKNKKNVKKSPAGTPGGKKPLAAAAKKGNKKVAPAVASGVKGGEGSDVDDAASEFMNDLDDDLLGGGSDYDFGGGGRRGQDDDE